MLALQQIQSFQMPATQSLFPTLEKWLESSDHQEVMSVIVDREKQEKYYDMLDCLFCEIFSEYQERCFLYYDEKGPALRKIISKAQRLMMERILTGVVKGAYEVVKKHRT